MMLVVLAAVILPGCVSTTRPQAASQNPSRQPEKRPDPALASVIDRNKIPVEDALTIPEPPEAFRPSARAARAVPTGFSSWRPLFHGVWLTTAKFKSPRLMSVQVVRVDLEAPGLDFLVTPPNGSRPMETDSLRTSTYLEKYNLQLAINASPFGPVVVREGQPQDVVGLAISNGELYSEPHKGYAALLIHEAGHATIADQPCDVRGVRHAVGGFARIVDDGKNTGGDGDINPRTAVGVSEDGMTLYFIVVDGRRPRYSMGATTGEIAQILLDFGARNAVNLDGGGSTTLVMQDANGKPKIINRPISGIPLTRERANANHLGIYAQPVVR